MQLPGDELLAGACLPSDQERDVRRCDLVEGAEDLDHARMRADHRAAAARAGLKIPGEVLVLDAQLVQEKRVLEDEACLGCEHLEELEVVRPEQRTQALVPDIQDADEAVLGEEGHAHHGLQLQIHHRAGLPQDGVVHGVADDDNGDDDD